ncbi:hypothetical protein [Pseudotenacibaculum haliotis]|uniref:Macroglobulin domain-containing protein n=1 Tax=Pseudotenacibaculum haliotis TaxID=1862138 RepID=A0ABW5LTN6_9FLAO
MKLKFFALTFFLGFALCYAKNTTISTSNDKEIIYLKTDRDVYEVGERVWFSTIHLGSKTLAPKYNSSILYFLLLDKEKKVIDRKKFRIRKGTTNGSYLIPNHLDEGVYYILTYTQNSLDNLLFLESTKPIMVHKILPKKMYIEYDSNLGEEDHLNLHLRFYKKNKVPVTKARVKLIYWDKDEKEKSLSYRLKNTDSLHAVIKKPKRQNLNYIKVEYKDSHYKETFFVHLPNIEEDQILFYPEGGFLQHEQEQFIGFKVKSIYKKLEYLYVYENGQFLKKVPVTENGIGKFSLRFQKGNQYHVKTQMDGKKIFPILLNSKEDGIRISLAEGKENYKRLLKIVPGSHHQKEQITLKVFSKGTEVHAKNVWVEGSEVSETLHTGKIYPGVFLVAAYNTKGDLLSYRFGFHKKPSTINISALQTPKLEYRIGEKINLSVSPKLNTEPIKVRYATSVYKKTLDNSSFNKNLFMHYLLDSEFISSIQSTTLNNATLTSDIDNLLLTMSIDDYRWNPKNTFPKIRLSEKVQVKAMKKAYKQDIAPAANMHFLVRCDNGIYNYISDKDGLFQVDRAVLSSKKCYLLPPYSSFDLSILLEVKDLVKSLDPIIPKLEMFKPSEHITFSTTSKAFIDEVGFSFSSTNLLEDIDFDRKHDPSQEEYEINPNDYVCFSNILNCKNHREHPQNTKPIVGKIYRYRVSGEYMVDVSYKAPKKQYPPQIFTFERPESFQEIASTNFDIHHKTSLWSPFKTSKVAGKINLQLVAPDTQGTYVMMVDAYDHRGNLGTYQVEFVVK